MTPQKAKERIDLDYQCDTCGAQYNNEKVAEMCCLVDAFKP